MGDALGRQRLDDHLGLAGRHDPVLEALQQDDRAGEPVGVVDGRALGVAVPGLGPGADQAVEVAGLELVGVLGQRGQVGHPVVGGAGRGTCR